MAYKSWSKGLSAIGGYSELVNGSGDFLGIEGTMLAMGWTLYDGGFSTQDFAVFRSKGEDGGKQYGYISFTKNSGNSTIEVQAWLAWNSTTHVGVHGTNAPVTLKYGASTVAWIWGDADMVVMRTYTGGQYTVAVFGHVPNMWRHCGPNRKIVGSLTPGSNVTATLDSLDGIVQNKFYQILGVGVEGIERVYVSAVDSATSSVTISTLNGSFSSGSVIALVPLALFNNNPSARNQLLWASYTGGIKDGPADGYWDLSLNEFVSYRTDNPDWRSDSYPIQQLNFGDYRVNTGNAFRGDFMIGHGNDRIVRFSSAHPLGENDVLYVGSQVVQVTTGSNGSNSLKKTGANWVAGAYANKLVVVLSGTGAGEIHTITNNTTDTLTIDESWVNIPQTNDQFTIADNAYRVVPLTNTFKLACAENFKPKSLYWAHVFRGKNECNYYDGNTGSGYASIFNTMVYHSGVNNYPFKWAEWSGGLIMFNPQQSGDQGAFVICPDIGAKVTHSDRGGEYRFDYGAEAGDGSVTPMDGAYFGVVFLATASIYTDFANTDYYLMGIKQYNNGGTWERRIFLNRMRGGTVVATVGESGNVSALSRSGWVFRRYNSTFTAELNGTVIWEISDSTIVPNAAKTYVGLAFDRKTQNNTTGGYTFRNLSVTKNIKSSDLLWDLVHEDLIVDKVAGTLIPNMYFRVRDLSYANKNPMSICANAAGASMGLYDHAANIAFDSTGMGGAVEFDAWVLDTDGNWVTFFYGFPDTAYTDTYPIGGFMIRYRSAGNGNTYMGFYRQSNNNQYWFTDQFCINRMKNNTIDLYEVSTSALTTVVGTGLALKLRIEINRTGFQIYGGTNRNTLISSSGDAYGNLSINSRRVIGFAVSNVDNAYIIGSSPLKVYRRVR